MRNDMPSGYVIYKGPSLLDGQPIVAILTGLGKRRSVNEKTGAMSQTWILPDNGIAPHINVRSGADASVCGDCKHRPINGGACYVRVHQGARSVYAAYLRGRYGRAVSQPSPVDPTLAALGTGRTVRLGAYGDPAAVPAYIWRELLSRAAGWTGYTHQWRTCAASLQPLVMASCDTPEERAEAQAQGWRTFTVRMGSDALAPRESVCPASHEAGRKLTCAQCQACNGTSSGRKGSIAIIVHGALAKRYIAFRSA